MTLTRELKASAKFSAYVLPPVKSIFKSLIGTKFAENVRLEFVVLENCWLKSGKTVSHPLRAARYLMSFWLPKTYPNVGVNEPINPGVSKNPGK